MDVEEDDDALIDYEMDEDDEVREIIKEAWPY